VELVLVEWIDSCKGEGWTVLEDLQENHSVKKCKSVGWIVARDSESVTLAGHLGENPTQCCGDMTIPFRSIVRMSELPSRGKVTTWHKRKLQGR
jgi:hypothetical protein